MMDALGVGKPSLLKGEENEELSKETMEDIEETRRKLAEVSVSQELDYSMPNAALKAQSSVRYGESSKTTDTDDSAHFKGCQNDFSPQNTPSTQLRQLWWLALSRMEDENLPKCSSLRTAWKTSVVQEHLSDYPSQRGCSSRSGIFA
jgi:hypothetical protein